MGTHFERRKVNLPVWSKFFKLIYLNSSTQDSTAVTIQEVQVRQRSRPTPVPTYTGLPQGKAILKL